MDNVRLRAGDRRRRVARHGICLFMPARERKDRTGLTAETRILGAAVQTKVKVTPMRKAFTILPLIVVWAVSAFGQGSGGAPPSPPVRPIGVVTKIQAGGFTLHTDAGPDLLIVFADGVSFLRVPPGVTNLNTATKTAASDINAGDRVLVRGRVSEDQKSFTATSVIVMTKSDLTTAREAERLDWQRRGMSGTVQALNAEAREITVMAPAAPPTPGNPTRPVTVALGANAVLLRYAPDSVKFSDAKPSTFEQIKVGDQVRALGTKSEDGSRFTVEKLVSGTFRNFGVTVVSVDAQNHAIAAKDLASGQPILVRTNADSKLQRLPPALAHSLATLNAGAKSGSEPGDQSLDVQQMLERAPALDLGELKPGDPLIVVSTEGAKQTEVTAIDIFAGVEPILAARPKGSNQVVMGSWSLGMNGGDGGP
jgi:hypothetical protein